MKESGKRKKKKKVFERPIAGMLLAMLLMLLFEAALGSIAILYLASATPDYRQAAGRDRWSET